MPKLPVVGGDQGTWGNILNDYLLSFSDGSGNLKANSVTQALASANTPISFNNQPIMNVGFGSSPSDVATIGQIPTPGTSPGTFAEGNDSRIINALQAENNLKDVANAAEALANLGGLSVSEAASTYLPLSGGPITGDLSVAGDFRLPNSTFSAETGGFTGGAIRQSIGAIFSNTFTQTTGPIYTMPNSDMTGINPYTYFTGSQSLDLTEFVDAPTTGEVSLIITVGSTTEKVIVSYSGVTQNSSYTSLNNCKYVSGPTNLTITGGTIFTSGVTYVTSTNIDDLLGTGLWININPTVDYRGGVFGVQPDGPAPIGPRAILEIDGVFTFAQSAGDASIGVILGLGPVIQNEVKYTNASGVVTPLVNAEGYVNVPTVEANNAAISFVKNNSSDNIPGSGQGWGIGYWDGQVYQGVGTGTITGIESVSFYSTGVFNSGASGFQHVGVMIDDAGLSSSGSSLDMKIGLAIGKLQDNGISYLPYSAATNNIGLLNASTTSFTPDYQTVSSGFTVNPNASCVALTSSASESATTSSVTIAPPANITFASGSGNVSNVVGDGQLITVVNANSTASGYTLTFTSSTTTGLSLGAATRTLSPGGSLTLIYNQTFGRWVEVGFNVGGF